jgi:hypothetical protein
LAQKEVTFTSQFRNALTLGPSISEDDMVLEEVTHYEAVV